jgi:hypothetical protein
MTRTARGALVLIVAAATSVVSAQGSSTQYRVTGGSLVGTAGTTGSAALHASIVGAEGAPAGRASSPQFAVVIGSGDPAPVDAEAIFDAGFENAF